MFNRHKSILPSVSIDKDIDNPVLDKPSELVKNLEKLVKKLSSLHIITSISPK